MLDSVRRQSEVETVLALLGEIQQQANSQKKFCLLKRFCRKILFVYIFEIKLRIALRAKNKEVVAFRRVEHIRIGFIPDETNTEFAFWLISFSYYYRSTCKVAGIKIGTNVTVIGYNLLLVGV